MTGGRSAEVLVAGGGPAGLAAAIALRQRGADVLLVDGVRPPVDKACGEGLMPDARRELARLGVDANTTDGAEFAGIAFAAGEGRVAADFPLGTGLGVRRTALHALLVERAAELGVRMLWGSTVTLRAGEAAAVDGEPVAYRWMVAADGLASRVRTWAELDAGEVRSLRFGFRAHFRVEPWSRYVEIHWGRRGQVYVTPVGPQEVGVAAITREPGVRLDAVIAEMPALRERLTGAVRTSAERGAVTMTRRLRRVTRSGVALVGDASGSVDAVTGEGLALGFRQALLLADSLDTGGLERYEAGHGRILALPQRMAGLMLLLDRFPALRARALPALERRPELFRGMLAVHVGEQPLERFVLRHGVELGALLVAPGLA